MIYYYPDIQNDIEFKKKIIQLEKCFKELEKKNQLTTGLLYIKKKYLIPIYGAVLNKKILKESPECYLDYAKVIPDLYQDGIDFLSTKNGKIFIDIIHYFANFYKVPDEQKGGYDV